jgi:subtilase family serine protease
MPLILFLLNAMLWGETAAQNRIAASINDSDTVAVRHTAHPLALPQFDLGPVDRNMLLKGVSITFQPSPAQKQALQQLLSQQQDPKSPNYRKWVTPDEFGRRFGMSDADLAKVTDWLQRHNLKVTGVSHSRLQISFSGSAAAMEQALKSPIHNYLHNGEIHFANSGDVSLPAAFAGTVMGIRGLSDFRPKPRAQRRIVAMPRFTSNLSGNHFLAPDDFATIYNLQTLYSAGHDGSGIQLAVMGQTDINYADLDSFRTNAARPARTSSNFQKILVPGSGTSVVVSNDLGEADLDLEWSQGVAKNANLVYVYTGNSPNFNVWDALQYAVSTPGFTPPVVSISYGNCEANLGISFANTVQMWVQEGNAQGQTVVAAAGDAGAADCDTGSTATQGFAVDIPAAVPEVTGLGGTTFEADMANPNTYWNSTNNSSNGSAISYIGETAWNDTAIDHQLSSGGGGASTFFSKPSWQSGAGVPNDGKRDVPDISLASSADHDGYLICSSGSCVNGFRDANSNLNVIGGTSVAAPTFAGIVAILNQITQSGGLGNINPTLYSLAGTAPAAFHDITSGNNIVPCTSGTPNCPSSAPFQYGFTAAAGYDQATGLGTVDADQLLTAWPNSGVAPSFAVTSTAITISSPGQSGTSTVTVSGSGGYSGSVSLTCAPTNTSVEITCSLSPTSVSIDSTTTSATSALTVKTTAPSASNGVSSGSVSFPRGGTGLIGATILLALLAGLRGPRRAVLGGAFLLATMGWTGCGGGSSTPHITNPGTPAGTYTVTVTATDSSGTAHTSSVSVTVQ